MKVFIASALGVLLVIFLITSGVRWFSAATTSISTIAPKPGVECVLAVTADGVAISCWKTNP